MKKIGIISLFTLLFILCLSTNVYAEDDIKIFNNCTEMQLDVKEHVIFDIIVFVVMVCLGALYYLILKATHGIFLKEGPHGDPYLFVVYLGALISFGINMHFIKNLIHADEINMCLRFNDLDATAYVSQMAEYNRAYNDIMERFEEYFAEEESEEEQEEATLVEEVIEETAPVEEVAEETAPAKEVVEEIKVENNYYYAKR